MMKSIVEEKLVSFKELEKKVFDYVCVLGREITSIMLENYDAERRNNKNLFWSCKMCRLWMVNGLW